MPLTDKLLIGDDVHGETGLDGWDFPEPEVPLHSAHAVDLIHNLLGLACSLICLRRLRTSFRNDPSGVAVPVLRPQVLDRAFAELEQVCPSAWRGTEGLWPQGAASSWGRVPQLTGG